MELIILILFIYFIIQWERFWEKNDQKKRRSVKIRFDKEVNKKYDSSSQQDKSERAIIKSVKVSPDNYLNPEGFIESIDVKVDYIDYYFESDIDLKNLIDYLRSNSTVYPTFRKDIYFQTVNFKNTNHFHSYDEFIIHLSSICRETNTCLKIHLYLNIGHNVLLFFDNRGELVEEAFGREINSIDSDYNSSDGGLIYFDEFYRWGDGFVKEFHSEHVSYFKEIPDNINDFKNMIDGLESELNYDVGPLYEKDLSNYFKEN